MKRHLKLISCTVIIILFMYAGNLFSQVPYFRQIVLSGTGISFKINSICQDSSRFVWLATNDGLWKNDGIGFIKVRLPEVLQQDNITAIYPLPHHGILAGTAQG